MSEWQDWFLAEEKRMTAGKFMQNIIKRTAEELETKFNIEIVLDVKKNKRNVIGYEMEIIDNRKQGKIDFYTQVNQAEQGGITPNEIQTDIFNFIE